MHGYIKVVTTVVGAELPHRLFNHYHPLIAIHSQIAASNTQTTDSLYDHTDVEGIHAPPTSPSLSMDTRNDQSGTVGENSSDHTYAG